MTPEAAVAAMLARHGMPAVGRRAHDLCLVAVRNNTTADRFDDVFAAFSRDIDGGAVLLRKVFRCTTDPGKAALLAPMNPGGTWRLKGDHRHKGIWAPGFHKGDPNRPGLRQRVPIVGERDNDRDAVFDAPVPASDGQGVNLHGGRKAGENLTQPVGNYSHGCVVGAQEDVDDVRELVALQKAAGMGDVVSLHLFRRETNPESAVLFALVGLPG